MCQSSAFSLNFKKEKKRRIEERAIKIVHTLWIELNLLTVCIIYKWEARKFSRSVSLSNVEGQFRFGYKNYA